MLPALKEAFEEPQADALTEKIARCHHLLIQGALKRASLRSALVIPA